VEAMANGNIDDWRPTKFVRTARGLKASRIPAHVSVSSRFMVDNVGPYYERAIRAHAHGRLLDMGRGYVPLYETYRAVVSENICIDWQNQAGLRWPSLQRMGVETRRLVNVGKFTEGQRGFLEYHPHKRLAPDGAMNFFVAVTDYGLRVACVVQYVWFPSSA
jgi:hypothetical protein